MNNKVKISPHYTWKDFYIIVGVYFRQIVNTSTKKYKNKIGECEKCGVKKSKNIQLDFAHKKKYNRKDLVNKLYKKHGEFNDSLIKEFKQIHKNPSKIGFVYCVKCHTKYDKKQVLDLFNKMIYNEIL